MRPLEIIAAKRDGLELPAEAISKIVLDYSNDELPDYQMSAFLMAAFIRGLSFNEIFAMTKAMIDSGQVVDLSSVDGIKVDKHSTGGVGDKTTLVVVPILAACGLKSPKMSGRGLGFTGGTLDKLESIPGFNTALSQDQFVRQINEIGAAIAGQSHDIVPADKKIYALRDVTGTVESIHFVAASVMSKKIACSSDIILLDVKTGSGAFADSIGKAIILAHTMIAIGKAFGRKVGAVITDMNQPLGNAVGNALEVAEAIDTLKGQGPNDVTLLCVELSAQLLHMSDQVADVEAGRVMARGKIQSGEALGVFRRIVRAQGGDARVIDDISLLPKATITQEVASPTDGIVSNIVCNKIGLAASILGAGRERKENAIDPSVGVVVKKKLGDAVGIGEPIAVIHANDAEKAALAEEVILGAYSFSDFQIDIPPLIYDTFM